MPIVMPHQFSGVDGFLGSRASLMLDVVVVAMLLVIPLLGLSIYFVRVRRNFALHRRINLLIGALLLLAIIAFEVDMRFMTDWKERAAPSPFFELGAWNAVWLLLIVHLCFAIPTAVLWIFVIAHALRRFPTPVAPNTHSRTHMLWARLAAVGMAGTAGTGWVFYWLAFVA